MIEAPRRRSRTRFRSASAFFACAAASGPADAIAAIDDRTHVIGRLVDRAAVRAVV